MSKRLFTGLFFLVSLCFMVGESYACPILKAIIGRSDVRPVKPTWIYVGGGTGFVGCESVGSIVNCTWSLPGAYDIRYETHRYPNDHVTCNFGAVGQYTVTLTVTDNLGRTDTDTCTVYVVSIGIGIAPGESSYVAVNNDDDNENGIMDMAEEGTVTNEDTEPYDLRKILLYVQTPKTSDKVVLGVGPEIMKIWSNRDKQNRVVPPPDKPNDYWAELPAWSSPEPHEVYVEALSSWTPSVPCVGFGYVGVDESTTPPTERVPEGNPPDPINFTLLEVDVDIEGVQDDYYRDGPETEETKPGGFIALNDDDDNNNETPDKDENGPILGENDLVKITLWPVSPTQLPIDSAHPVTLKAISGGDKIRIWDNETKTGDPVGLPKHYYSRTDFSKNLWVEGVGLSSTPRDITLALEYAGFEDRIRFTVFKLDVEIYTNGSWHNITDDNITVLNGTKYPFRAIIDPELAPWPSDKFSWSYGAATSSEQTVEVTFDSIGTQTLTATFYSCSRNVTINVVAPTVYQIGFANDNTLYKTPSAWGGWADGTTLITDPVYDTDANNKNDSVCVTKNSSTVSLSGVKLKVPQALTYSTTTLVDANGTYNWNESAGVSFSGTTSGAATLGIKGNIINQVKKYDGDFQIQWKYRVPAPSGTNTWYGVSTTSHTVYVKYGDTTGGHSLTEKRIEWLCSRCDDNTTAIQCSDDIYTALEPSPPDFVLGGGNPSNKWIMMDTNGPTGECISLAMLMQDMYQLLGCGDGEIGYIYATRDAACYSTSDSDNETRTCPGGTHGGEVLRYYAGGGWNNWEAVFHVNGIYYAVKETKDSSPLQVIKTILGSNLLGGNHQAWRYYSAGWQSCTIPPYPVPLPP